LRRAVLCRRDVALVGVSVVNADTWHEASRPGPVDRLLAPLRNFLHTEASGGLLLLAAAVVALVWANSPFAESYEGLWSTAARTDLS
jgi:hypothetical protein